MSKSNKEAAKKVLETPRESASENEESDSITDQSNSTTPENADQQRLKNDNKYFETTKISAITTQIPATQFSVQRSDADGLRMRISAIRPVNIVSGKIYNLETMKETNKRTSPQSGDKVNNNTIQTFKVRKNHKSQQLQEITKKPARETSKKMAVTDLTRNGDVTGAVSVIKSNATSNSKKSTITKLLIPQEHCDATESSCSDTTIATNVMKNTKTSKKIKVKRKKAQSKIDNAEKSIKKSDVLALPLSSDSEDEPLKLKQLQLQQRAPRLLLTAINSRVITPQLTLLNSLSSSVTPPQCSDNIGLSSSDNELPDLVSAAIKRVESDTDDTGEGFRKEKSKNLPKYQSTLLQDFMEKTQMLGQTPARMPSPDVVLARPMKTTRVEILINSNSNPQSDSIISNSEISKKRRGRPKKVFNATEETYSSTLALVASNINESPDSGVISTTSPMQISAHRKSASTATITNPDRLLAKQTQLLKQQRKSDVEVAATDEVPDITETIMHSSKPKIDIAYLDKRMYATERVLYPPPRNKRRQSLSAIAAKADRKSIAISSTKLSKEELQLDPVWRKIDVNKKFRRPSVGGYKSDGGGGNTTICSKILAAKSGYVSDYSSLHPRSHQHHQNSGYKSDASYKSRYSTKSCASRRNRAKSCGYRSDCKESAMIIKSTKFRRKRRCSLMKAHSKSVGNLNDEQDILQLAGLSLGQSSEDSNEYVCKPRLECLPTTSVSKKYGEINRFIATGEYFGRGSTAGADTFDSLHPKRIYDTTNEDGSQDGFVNRFSGKLLLQRKNSLASDILPHTSRKIKSRRSSAASYCSSYYSGTSKLRRRRRRKNYRFPQTGKFSTIDSKLLTEIEIITNTFAMCRINNGGDKTVNPINGKDKLFVDANKLQGLSSGGSGSSKREGRDKRTLKKRKMSENMDFSLISANAGALTPSSGSTKRRHKKASSSSPDDHKLPLKKRHYLLTPGEKSSEAVAVAAKLFASNAEAWAAAAAIAKTSATTKSQQQFSNKASKTGLTPKKRHLLQNSSAHVESSLKSSNSSPLRIVVDTASISSGQLFDISPISMSGSKQPTEVVHKKRSRLEGLVTKIAHHTDEQAKDCPTKNHRMSIINVPQLDSETSCPPPGVFEPSVELEIQIPPITKLTEAAVSIITKSEVDSPLLMDISKSFTSASTKSEGTRVVEALLSKTGGNLLLKRKRKKINRTGFPTVRRKKRKINENLLLDVTPDISNQTQRFTAESSLAKAAAAMTTGKSKSVVDTDKVCDRVPQLGEASDTFLERASRTPRLSVVALERLQGTPTPYPVAGKQKVTKTKHRELKRKLKETPIKQQENPKPETVEVDEKESTSTRRLGRKSKAKLEPFEGIKTEDTATASLPKHSKKFQINSEKTTLIKSSIHKIITAKSLEARVKLPAGIDPNTNFSCKIRLKRRSALNPIEVSSTSKEMVPQTIDITAEAAAKDAQNEQLEHDVLPLNDANGLDSEAAASDTSDEKSSTASVLTVRKLVRLKKSYLPAGLFSEYFKREANLKQKALPLIRKVDKYETTCVGSAATSDDSLTFTLLLPPPPYCEKYFRRTQDDFVLPYDIWWAYTNSKLPTRITVPSWNYRKIRTNVYAESVRPNTTGIDHPTCNCKSDFGCGDNCLNRMVYTECSPSSCPTRDKCRNQKIQRHEVAPGVERFMTENKGWGVRTKLPIKKGTYILEYVGEVVTEREFKDRMGTIYLNDIHHYCLHLDGGLVIDGHRMGSDGRFVNHSCQPNCEMQKWSVNGLSRMALFAKRHINEGEEISYDYNFSLFNPSEGQPCRCNAPQCRGVIGGKSQRVKPLPIEVKPSDYSQKDACKGRQRKRQARKNTQRLLSKDVVVARVQQLSEKEKKLVKQHGIFLLRNYEKIRRCKSKRVSNFTEPKTNTPTPSPDSHNSITPSVIVNRRPSTPSSLAAQISALCSPRNIKTRGLTHAVQDPEVEKMAKMAVILRDICVALETLKCPGDKAITLISVALSSTVASKKKKVLKTAPKKVIANLKTVQANIEQGYYKQPAEFDDDMQKIFAEAKLSHNGDQVKLKAIETLITGYKLKKQENYSNLLELVCEEAALASFRPNMLESTRNLITNAVEENNRSFVSKTILNTQCIPTESSTEDIIRCICGMYKDEGLMIQCARCMVWQHTECTKADVNADNYLCEKCEQREVDREIPLEDFTEEGRRYYLTLMRGNLHVRQGDAVYVLRDIPVKDVEGNVVPAKKHTYETIGDTDYNECDIFRVERLWKNEEGQRFIFGHHFLRPHETFHEPSRRFYPNEVVRVPLYEVIPIELVIGRCWVLDRTTFCKGRPIECIDDEHCYICELRVDKSARFFSKAKVNYPICTKSYAFRKFAEKLKISKTYAPHDVDPSMLKTKRQKTCNETAAVSSGTPGVDLNKTLQATRTRQCSHSPATVYLISPVPLSIHTLKVKRKRLENVLKTIKRKRKNVQMPANEPTIDLSYLLSGRGARQRKTMTASSTVSVPV